MENSFSTLGGLKGKLQQQFPEAPTISQAWRYLVCKKANSSNLLERKLIFQKGARKSFSQVLDSIIYVDECGHIMFISRSLGQILEVNGFIVMCVAPVDANCANAGYLSFPYSSVRLYSFARNVQQFLTELIENAEQRRYYEMICSNGRWQEALYF